MNEDISSDNSYIIEQVNSINSLIKNNPFFNSASHERSYESTTLIPNREIETSNLLIDSIENFLWCLKSEMDSISIIGNNLEQLDALIGNEVDSLNFNLDVDYINIEDSGDSND